jgi:hypothetical protein
MKEEAEDFYGLVWDGLGGWAVVEVVGMALLVIQFGTGVSRDCG